MRKRRVGTLSLGILLIGLGIALLMAQILKTNTLNVLFKWWPIIFVALGLEVLLYTYTAKEEQPKVKYDIFSIFMIFVLIFSGIGMFALQEVGLISRASKMVSANNFIIQTPQEDLEIDRSIKKIIIDYPQNDLTIRAGEGDTLSAFGSAYVTADTKENAEKMLVDKRIVTRENGNTLYVSFNLPHYGNDFDYSARIRDFTIIVPGNRQVEIKGRYNSKIIADNLQNDWLIETNDDLEVLIPEDANATVKARTERSNGLLGNVEWQVEQLKKGEENDGYEEFEGTVKFGNGTHKLNILSLDRVTVNKI